MARYQTLATVNGTAVSITAAKNSSATVDTRSRSVPFTFPVLASYINKVLRPSSMRSLHHVLYTAARAHANQKLKPGPHCMMAATPHCDPSIKHTPTTQDSVAAYELLTVMVRRAPPIATREHAVPSRLHKRSRKSSQQQYHRLEPSLHCRITLNPGPNNTPGG